MATARRWWLSAGAVLLVGSVGYQLLVATDLMARRNNNTDEPSTSDTSIRVVDIATDGTIRIVARVDGRPTIDITRKLSSGLRAPTVSRRRDGDRVVLRASCPTLLPLSCRVDFALVIPPGTRVIARSAAGDVQVSGMLANVDADSSAGSVTIEESFGAIKAHSSAGNVTLSQVGGVLDASSSAGSVIGKDLRSRIVTANSTAGEVALTFTEPPTSVTATSTAGSVSVAVPRNDMFYRTETSGDNATVNIRSDPQSKRTIKANSTAGPVRVVYADTVE
jgi:hypothetical protein